MDASINQAKDINESVTAQAKVRLGLGLPVIILMGIAIWYWGSPFGDIGYQIAILLVALHCTYIVVIYFLTRKLHVLDVGKIILVTAVLDPIMLSGWVGVMSEAGGLFVCFYLFTILGFGFRIGVKPMLVCQISALTSYCIVLAISPTWRAHPLFGFSFLMLLLVVPMYATVLIKKLRSAWAHAENESQAKSQLLANVSHELRTPLAGIIASTQLITDSTNEPLIHKRTEIIERLSKSLLVEINNLLDSAKYQANSLSLEREPFEIQDILNQVYATLESTAAAKNVRFSVSMNPMIKESVYGDAHYLNRVLINIAGNAVKFTEEGYVAVRVQLLEEKAESYLVRFSVKDTGIGVPKELHQKIFEPFVQASTGTTRKYGGTGLGMSIANDIVHLMGGDIFVESEVGKGSLFYFDLKFEKSGVAKRRDTAETVENIVVGKRILVADDNATNLLLIQELLLKDRHLVITAANGKNAIELLASTQFDLIFLDFNMGDMDGRTVLQIYRFGKVNPAPVFFLTADTTERTAKLLQESGAVGVLHKPISIHDLRKAIAQVFNAKRNASSNQEAKSLLVAAEYIDQTIINSLKDLSSRADFLSEVLSVALKDMEKNYSFINEGINSGDIEMVHEKAHALKGLCLSIGANKLSLLAEKLMRISRDELSKENQKKYQLELAEIYKNSIEALGKILLSQSIMQRA